MSRLRPIIAGLARFYGRLPRPPHDPFGCFVWEVLSARTTATRRDMAFGALKRVRVLTPDSMSRAPQAKLSAAVGLAGPYLEQRLTALRTGADVFRRSAVLSALAAQTTTAARRALRPLPQLDAAGARRLLLFTTGHRALPSDARVGRVARRLGLGRTTHRVRAQERAVHRAIAHDLADADVDEIRHTFLYLAHHGDATCTEGDPHCFVCPLRLHCPEGQARVADGSRVS